MEAPQQQRQISPFQRTKSFSASSVANRQIVVSAPLETVISTRGSGDLAVSNNHSALLQNRSSSLTGKSLEVMDGAGDKNRGRSGSLLQTWFGGNDGGGLNEVEQAELEIERMINKIRRDLNHMHDQDLYFSKWIGTLGRKIDALESAVYLANGDYPEAHDEQDEVDSHAVACNGVQDEESNPFSPITTCSTASFSETTSTQSKPLSRSSSQLSAATASSGISDITNGSVDPDSDYSTDHKLQTITERHGMTSQSSDASVTSPQKASRVTSMDSVDSLFKKEGCQGVKLSRQGSSSSGIHADELLAMYSKREKGVRQELGLASQGSTPNKHASILGDLRSPSNASLVHEHPDEETLADGDATPRLSSTFSPNTSMNSGTSGNPQYSTPSTDVSAPKGLPNPLVDVPKPVLEYSEIFGPPSSAIESLTSPTSPGPDEDFLTPRLSKRNSGIFGSVRLRASLRNLTRNRISTDKTSSPSNKSEDSNSSPSSRPEKSRWRWGSVRGTNSSSS